MATTLKQRHQLDKIMLNLDKVPADKQKKAYLAAGLLMAQLHLIDQKEKENIAVIIKTYNDHIIKRIRSSAQIRRKGS